MLKRNFAGKRDTAGGEELWILKKKVILHKREILSERVI